MTDRDFFFDYAASTVRAALPWEVLLLRYDKGCPVAAGERIPDEAVPGDALGTAAAVKAAIAGIFPSVEWRYPDQGYVDVDGVSFNFNVHFDDPPYDVMVRVSDEGDPFPRLCQLLVATGWTGVDLANWGVLDPASPDKSGWRTVRDAVARAPKRPPWG